MKLSPHFTLQEFIESGKAKQLKIDNAPDFHVAANLMLLASVLEQVRALFNSPIKITSGYRCQALNKAVGGVSDSAHTKGLAADIQIAGLSSYDIVEKIKASNISFDQVINEGSWVHIGLSEYEHRFEVLTMKNGKYFKGNIK